MILVGGRNYGVQTGAEYYFNTDASNLSIAQCAFLAGINNSPNAYNPYSGKDNTEKIKKRTKTVLGQMKKCGYINQEEYDSAVAEVEAGFNFENGVKGNVYSSHTDALISQLIDQIAAEKNISKTAGFKQEFQPQCVSAWEHSRRKDISDVHPRGRKRWDQR